MDKAAQELGMDRVAIRRINAPDSNAKLNADQGPVTSAYMAEALDLGAKRWNWAEKAKRSGRRKGSKVTGIGVGQGYHAAGTSGFDGLVRITPPTARSTCTAVSAISAPTLTPPPPGRPPRP